MGAVLLASVGWFAQQHIRDFHFSEVERRLLTAAELLAEDARAILLAPDDSPTLADPIKRLAHENDLRVSIIRLDGEVVSDSAATLPLPSHAERPELIQARAAGVGSAHRTSATTTTGSYYLARRLDLDDQPLGYIRITAELNDMAAQMTDLLRALVLVGLIGLMAVLIASSVVARWLTRPVLSIQETAEALAAGQLERRARVDGPIEIERLAVDINRMADQIERQFSIMESSRSETEAIHASMTEGVVAVDQDERILLMNNAAAHLLGLPAPLAPGDPLWKEARFPDLELAIRDVLDGGDPWHGDAQAPVGGNRIVSVSVTRVNPEIGAVALLTDVTTMRRLDNVRIDFVANVSHEMRTPLTAVLGAIETLAEPDVTPDVQHRFLDIARRNALRMQNIVADLLELSHIEVDGSRMPMETIELAKPVRSAISAIRGTAERKSIAVTLESVGRPLPIQGNDKRLEQVFTNLVDNAIKYTPEGGRIEVTIHHLEDRVEVTVRDTGIGMPEASLARIFERFYRVDKSRSRDMGGTGLGLAIVKHCIRAHGGSVEVQSEEGRGTCFTVILPRRTASGGNP